MITRTLSCLVTAASLVVLPVVATAGSAEKAVSTCSEAFIQHLSTTYGPANYRVAKPAGIAITDSPVTAYHKRRIELTLTAVEKSSGNLIAMMECTAKPSGELIATTHVPADSARAAALRLSARNTK
ncbi:MAG TPA: hypothetical protein VIH25_12965 [Steroidobacteraceae bacterium]